MHLVLPHGGAGRGFANRPTRFFEHATGRHVTRSRSRHLAVRTHSLLLRCCNPMCVFICSFVQLRRESDERGGVRRNGEAEEVCTPSKRHCGKQSPMLCVRRNPKLCQHPECAFCCVVAIQCVCSERCATCVRIWIVYPVGRSHVLLPGFFIQLLVR